MSLAADQRDRPDVDVRRARSDEATALAAFAARTFVEAYPTIDPAAMRSFVAQHMTAAATAAALHDPAVALHVATVDGSYAGYVSIRRGPAPATGAARFPVELERIYVDAPWHGRGVANRLLSAALDQAEAWGGDELWLAVWEHNPRAIRFYEKHGFRPIGSQSFELAGLVQRDVVMSRRV